jgi:hypothetical protein
LKKAGFYPAFLILDVEFETGNGWADIPLPGKMAFP